jgi:hypothetical protein
VAFRALSDRTFLTGANAFEKVGNLLKLASEVPYRTMPITILAFALAIFVISYFIHRSFTRLYGLRGTVRA